MIRRRIALAFGLLVLVLALTVALGWYQSDYGTRIADNAGAVGGPFTLTDQTGATVTDRTYRGKWLLIYFGFTYCPDACPTALNNIAQALDALGPEAARIQPLLISVDPERDTPAVLRDYVAAFDSRIIGLTGTPEQVAAVARAYRVFYQRVGDGPDYTVDHITAIYVVDPDGRFDSLLAHDLTGPEMAKRLEKLL
jgi:protein SCO1/2